MLNHLITVKKEWKIIEELQRKSEFGLDDNLKMIIFNQKTYDMDGLSFIQNLYFWKLLTKGFNFSQKKKNHFTRKYFTIHFQVCNQIL